MFSIIQRQDFHYIGIVLKNYLLLYLCLSIIRAILYLYNHVVFTGLTIEELATIFLAGLRFDTVSIAYVHALFLIWHLIPTNWRASRLHKKIGTILWMGLNIPLLYLEFSDVVYYPYANRRITKSDLEMQQDIINLIPQFLVEFWWMFALVTLFSILLYKLYQKTRTEDFRDIGAKYWIVQTLIFILALGVNVIGMRGGLQLRPINSLTAVEYVNNVRYAPLAANSMINLIHSFGKTSLQMPQYMTDEEIKNHTPLYQYSNNTQQDPKPYNIVYLIVESFGKEFIHFFNKDLPNITPFTDSFLQQGYLFTQAHANGMRSSQGIVCATSGLPILMQDPFMFSSYSQNKIIGLPGYLSKIGYSTAFYHGGKNGTMNFDKFTKAIGYEVYFGKREYDSLYPDSAQAHYDGDWGVWDKPFFIEAIKQIGQQKQPFFATYFTLSPHHPFKTPSDYIVKDENHSQIQRSINYTDEALRLFFETAQKEPWYNNTLFIITGDHMNPPQTPAYATRATRYQIPILFFHPKDTSLRQKVDNRLAQQIDILPTILRYINYPYDFEAFGQDLFNTTMPQNYAYTFDGGIYQIMDEEHILLYDGQKIIGLYAYKTDTDLQIDIQQQAQAKTLTLLKALQARIQKHHQAFIKNTLPQ